MNRAVASIVASIFALFFILNGVSAAGAQEATATGLWLTQKGDARIQVSNCGSALCGKVVWLKDAIDPMTKKPQTDDKNPIRNWQPGR